ncbi:helix-turn-helix transcriptional regulator [Sediminicola arcticus]|jgi:plasmid maintenance system antidote protein VapI|uniref:Helix-turn-helix transcriptional regulator n=1 Tax=Sediminicola arcticus TaxID=1574308 RepID=A0ABV2SW78_9FLAO
MLNQDVFLKRLETIIEYYDLSASALADKIGVQRSSISHLLTGRNKPSLEFVLKVVHAFPEVDLYWLLQGDGIFPLNTDEKNATQFSAPKKEKEITPPSILTNVSHKVASKKTIQKIVFFYADGSFESYFERKE